MSSVHLCYAQAGLSLLGVYLPSQGICPGMIHGCCFISICSPFVQGPVEGRHHGEISPGMVGFEKVSDFQAVTGC